MKLNSLIKYNSFKILSILGHILFFAIIYFQYFALPAAFKIDKLAGCHFDANFPDCEAHIIEFLSLTVYLSISILIIFSLLIALFEFLYKKYKSKDKTIKNYPKFWIIVFWIGIIFSLIPVFVAFWCTISAVYETIHSYLSNFDIRYLLPPK